MQSIISSLTNFLGNGIFFAVSFLGLLATAHLPAQVNFPDFSSSTGLTLNGSASTVGNVLRLTTASDYQVGSAFTTNSLTLGSNASFSTFFQFRISGGGADGMAFVIQSVANNAIGYAGGYLGYAGIPRSVAVEFDTYYNDAFSDPSGNHVGFDFGGSVNSSTTANVSPSLSNGSVWSAWIDYNGATKDLALSLADNSTIRPTTPILSQTVDLPSALGSNNVFVGFTGATGGLSEYHDVLNFQFQYLLGNERHYAGQYNGQWNSTSSWTDAFGKTVTGAGAPTSSNPVFINNASVIVSQPSAQAQSVLVNGGKLVVDGKAGGSLTTGQNLELGNSLHQAGVASGQGWVKQVNGSTVNVGGDLVVGGKDSVYEMDAGSKLNVAGAVRLLDDTNAYFHQSGGDVFIGTKSAADANGLSTDGLLDLGRGTTYQMDGGTLDVATIQQTGLFVFNGGQLYVKQMLINTTPNGTPTYVQAPPTVTSPSTPGDAVAASGKGSGGGGCSITSGGGFTLQKGIVVLDQYSNWQLTGSNANLTVGQNSTGSSNGNFVQNGGNVSVDGSLIVGDGANGKGSYSMSSGSLVVHGQMTLGNDGGIGYYTQTGGTVTVDGPTTITSSSTGYGKFDIASGTFSTKSLLIGANGGFGELHLGPNGYATVAQNLVVGQNGKITGSGNLTVTGAQVTNNGIISPGNSPGWIHLASNFTQAPSGTLNMEIAGASVAGVDYDQLIVDGNATLAGSLMLDFLNGYAPKAGDTYALVQIGAGHTLASDLAKLAVQVENLEGGWKYSLSYDTAANTLELTSLSDGYSAIPEPSTYAALVGGAAFGFILMRRRTKA